MMVHGRILTNLQTCHEMRVMPRPIIPSSHHPPTKTPCATSNTAKSLTISSAPVFRAYWGSAEPSAYSSWQRFAATILIKAVHLWKSQPHHRPGDVQRCYCQAYRSPCHCHTCTQEQVQRYHQNLPHAKGLGKMNFQSQHFFSLRNRVIPAW